MRRSSLSLFTALALTLPLTVSAAPAQAPTALPGESLAAWHARTHPQARPAASPPLSGPSIVDLGGGQSRITVPVHPRADLSATVQGWLQQGRISSVQRSGAGDASVLTVTTAGNARQVATELQTLSQQAVPKPRSWLGAVFSQLTPSSPNAVPGEWKSVRAAQTAGAVGGSMFSYAYGLATLKALKMTSTEAAAAAASLNMLLGAFTSWGASYAGKVGDRDPKRTFMQTSGVATAQGLISLGVLLAAPQYYVPITVATTLIGAANGTIGGGAGANIANHMAREGYRSEVATVQARQDMLANAAGTGLALGLVEVAKHLGVSPEVVITSAAAPLLIGSMIKTAQHLRMEKLTPANLCTIVDHYVATGKIPEAQRKTVLATMKSIFVSDKSAFPAQLEFVTSLDQLVGTHQGAASAGQLFGLYSGESYLLHCPSKDKIEIGIKDSATLDDVMKAMIQARLVEQGLKSPLYTKLAEVTPGKELESLVQLSYRALPQKVALSETVRENGFHANVNSLQMPRLAASWAGTPCPGGVCLDLDKFRALTTTPDAQTIRTALGLAR